MLILQLCICLHCCTKQDHSQERFSVSTSICMPTDDWNNLLLFLLSYKKNYTHKIACIYAHVDPGPALTLIVPDLQMGRRVLGVVSEDGRQAVHLSVLAAQVQRRLSITVQSSRVSPCIQQSFHQYRLMSNYSQVQWCLREWEREKDEERLLIHSIKSTVYLRPSYI